jgi:hypothetical protein
MDILDRFPSPARAYGCGPESKKEETEKKKPVPWLEGFHKTGRWVRICELEPHTDIKDMMRNINSKRQPFWTKVNIDFDAFDAWRVTPYHEYKWML